MIIVILIIIVVYRVGERSSGVSSRSRCDRDSCLSPWLGAACFAFWRSVFDYCLLLRIVSVRCDLVQYLLRDTTHCVVCVCSTKKTAHQNG